MAEMALSGKKFKIVVDEGKSLYIERRDGEDVLYGRMIAWKDLDNWLLDQDLEETFAKPVNCYNIHA